MPGRATTLTMLCHPSGLKYTSLENFRSCSRCWKKRKASTPLKLSRGSDLVLHGAKQERRSNAPELDTVLDMLQGL